MIDSLTKAINQVNENKKYIIDYDASMRLDTVCVEKEEEYIDIRFDIINVDSLSYDISEDKTTLVDVIGVDESYQQIFDDLRDSTTLSKKDISNLLRHHVKCRQESSIIELGIKIHEGKIK